MAEIKPVAETYSVAPQLSLSDIAEAAALGYRTIVNNRPDGEAPDQPASAAMRKASEDAGLAYYDIPLTLPAPDSAVEKTRAMLAEAPRPILAFCRSGTRSATVWALAEAGRGLAAEDLVRGAARAGYDLSALRTLLERAGSE